MDGLHYTLKESSRWLLAVALVYAPWAYGCTVSWTAALLDALLAMAVFLRLVAWAAGRRGFKLPWIPVFCAAALVMQGCWLGWNAHFRHDPAVHLFSAVAAPFPELPGGIDRARVLGGTAHAAILLAALLCFCDAARRKPWRRRMLAVMAATGISEVLLGLLQRATDAGMIFWQPGPAGSPFFGTYYYHGNAGAFINLVLPLCAAFGFRALGREGALAGRAFWIPGFLLCLGAAAVNVSRAGAFLSALLAVVMVLSELWLARERLYSRVAAAVAAVTIAAAVAGLALSAGGELAWQKWGMLKVQLNDDNPRYLAAAVCREMVNDAGLWGFGPGTFAAAFPHYTGRLDYALRGVWMHAHEDYLQAAIEWGWIGAGLWGVLLFGGMARLLWRGHPEPDARLRLGCGLALAGMALHALVDFPFQIPSLQLYAAALLGVAWAKEPINVLQRGVPRNTEAGLRGRSCASSCPRRRESGGIAPNAPRDGRWHSRRPDSDPVAGPPSRR